MTEGLQGQPVAPGGFTPDPGCGPHPCALPPSSDPASAPSQGHQAWSEGIWGHQAPSDPGHTRAPPCGSSQTFTEALAIFLRAGATQNVGSAPGLVPEFKVGHRAGSKDRV